MASSSSIEPIEEAKESINDGIETTDNQSEMVGEMAPEKDLVVRDLELPEDIGVSKPIEIKNDCSNEQEEADMYTICNDDVDGLNFDMDAKDPLLDPTSVALDTTLGTDIIPDRTDIRKNLPPAMGTCEFCGYFGVKENFFSKSKRFCKVECAKKYSASNIKKKKPERAMTAKRKNVKKTLPTKRVKSDEMVTALGNPFITNEWQKKRFSWDEYLRSCNGTAAPVNGFRHAQVISCLKDIHIGMKVEVINNEIPSYNNAENITFWVATVIKFRHFKTLLRYEGYDDDDSADFWFDLRCPDIHPVGWCARINKPLIPPPEIKTRIDDWQTYLFKKLSGAKTFSAEFLKKVQQIPHNRFKVGMKVEVADRKNLYSVMCVATVVDVVGDRLRLRYDGLDPLVAEDFWCHYLSTDIHPVGWSSLVGHQLRPPIGWKESISEWNKLIEKILAQDRDAPQEIFSEDATGTAQGTHAFEVGMKFEGINPYIPNQICVLTVIKELKYNYFIAGIDSQAAYFCFHANSKTIFPPGWCETYGLQLTPPQDYPKDQFEWESYCRKTCGKKAPQILFQSHRSTNPFKPGMRLEAVDLREPALVCPATVVEVHGPLLKIHFDGWDVTYDQLVDIDSLDLFPVGYCDITGHPLQPPGPKPDPYSKPGYNFGNNNFEEIPAMPYSKDEQLIKTKSVSKSIHPENMFLLNRRCRCGPLLNPMKLLKLPETVKGVMGGSDKRNIARKCLQLLVSSGENPKQVLELFCREFYQSKNHADLDLGSTVCIEIKTKNDKRIMRRIKMATKSTVIIPYIERVCQLLDCCPNIFAKSKYPSEQCEHCRQLNEPLTTIEDLNTEVDDIPPDLGVE